MIELEETSDSIIMMEKTPYVGDQMVLDSGLTWPNTYRHTPSVTPMPRTTGHALPATSHRTWPNRVPCHTRAWAPVEETALSHAATHASVIAISITRRLDAEG
uniref:Uncharacterized protein n=1 Tax=Oryza punctata TaxID=4537 RepID=A0A0E0M4W7_ORYPU